jgi:hypothetical protein
LGTARSRAARPSLGIRDIPPTCTCGSQTLTWSTVVVLTVHTAGATMLGEVFSRSLAGGPTGTLTCGGCSRSWDLSRADLPARVQEATRAFGAALNRGDVGLAD